LKHVSALKQFLFCNGARIMLGYSDQNGVCVIYLGVCDLFRMHHDLRGAP